MREELTFAEAMALDPSEVGASIGVHSGSLASLQNYTLKEAREGRYWRLPTRPKRSRVQEMADDPDRQSLRIENVLAEAIRAVCEWLRDREAPDAGIDYLANAIESEFLEPR